MESQIDFLQTIFEGQFLSEGFKCGLGSVGVGRFPLFRCQDLPLSWRSTAFQDFGPDWGIQYSGIPTTTVQNLPAKALCFSSSGTLGARFEHKRFALELSWHPWDIWAILARMTRQKRFEGHTVTFRPPTPSSGIPPPHRKISGLATSLAFYRSQKGLSLKNSEKSPKRGFRGLSAPGSKKTRKRVENDYFSSFFRVFGPFSTFLRLFLSLLNPGAERPREPLSGLFFRSFPGRDLFDSCRRPTRSQIRTQKFGFELLFLA